jgi:hypothetical protein
MKLDISKYFKIHPYLIRINLVNTYHSYLNVILKIIKGLIVINALDSDIMI